MRDVLHDQIPRLTAITDEVGLLTVAVGANDVRRSRRDELAPALEVLLSLLSPGAVVATIPGRPQAVRPFNELIRLRASERGLCVAETAAAISPPFRGQLASDFFHPNDVGYAAWTRAFAEVVAPNML